MQKSNKAHLFMLFAAALIWGTAFVAQSVGAEYVGAYTYLAGRSWFAVAVLPPVIALLDKNAQKHGRESRRPKTPAERRSLLIAGAVCGTALCFASAAQQIGMSTTTTAKAGFLTAQYVVLVPIISIFLGRRPAAKIWGCVLVSLCGMYLLCMQGGGFTLAGGDLYMLLSALLFAVQILCVAHFGPKVDGVRLSWLQFVVVALESTVLAFALETPSWPALAAAGFSIAYAGILSSGVAYTLQILGTEGVNPTVACLAMSLESVFSALAGWVVLGQALSARELLGCLLMFAAIVLAQVSLPGRQKAGAAQPAAQES